MKTTKNLAPVDDATIVCQWAGGAQLDQMEELQSLIIETANSTYEITVLSGERGDILLRGGPFRRRISARLYGASLAGSLLKLRGIYAGLNMEFEHDGESFRTSPVRRIGIPQ